MKMMPSRDALVPRLNVDSSWKVFNEKGLEEVVTISFIKDYARDSEELTSMVMPEKCVCLHQETENDPCFVTLKFEPLSLSAMTRIIVVSEAKVIEVYGACREYLVTVIPEFLCEVEDMSVYCADIQLDHATRECSLKFARTSKVSDVWLYGVRVIWEPHPDGGSSSAAFNSFMTVDGRLKQCPTPLSEKAERCKEFIKLYGSLAENQRSSFNSVGLIPYLALANKESPSFLSTSNLPRNQACQIDSNDAFQSQFSCHKLLNNLPNANPIQRNEKINSSSATVPDVITHDCSGCTESFKALLDVSLQSMEGRLLKVIDEKLSKLQLLQEKHIESMVERMVKGMYLPGLDLKATHSQRSCASEFLSCNESQTTSLDAKLNESFTPLQNSLQASNPTYKEEECSLNSECELEIEKVLAPTDMKGSMISHDSLILDQNSNSLSASVPIKVPIHQQIGSKEKSVQINRLEFRSMMSLLCNRVSNDSKYHSGSIKDSTIEKAIMDTIHDFQGRSVCEVTDDLNTSGKP